MVFSWQVKPGLVSCKCKGALYFKVILADTFEVFDSKGTRVPQATDPSNIIFRAKVPMCLWVQKLAVFDEMQEAVKFVCHMKYFRPFVKARLLSASYAEKNLLAKPQSFS